MTSLFTEHLITSLIAVPFAGIVALLFVRGDAWVRRVALGVSLLALGLSAALWWRFDPSIEGMQFVERTSWMENFNIQYAVGVDGISLVMVLLTTLLAPLCVLASWTSIDSKARAFMSLVLLVEGAMIVVFTAMDLFLFFMLWEVTMIPMYFMIVLWGGPERIRAGIKFVIYSLTGSLLLLAGIFGLYLHAGPDLRPAGHRRARHPRRGADLDFRRPVPGLRHQAPDDPVPLLASRRALGGADRRKRDPGGRAPEDGRIRIPEDLPARTAGSVGLLRLGHSLAVDRRNPVRRLPCARAVGSQETGGLLLHLPHGLRHAGDLRLQRAGASRVP